MVSDELDFGGTTRFEILRRIGAGGMGVVYEAFDREKNARVALKTLRRSDRDSIAGLRSEFGALQGIEHRNLVRMGEFVQQGPVCFFTMELVAGVDFLSYVRPGTAACDEARLRASLKQLAEGIHALHLAGKVHRDIKPSNVRIGEDGRVVVLDFGLAIQVQPEGLTTATDIVGTADYMAPEQSAGEAAPAADWYSIGVVLYQSLTGRLPHTGSTDFDILMKKQAYPPPPPRQWTPGAPVDLDRLCADLLSIEAEDRPEGLTVLTRLGVEWTADPTLGPRKTALTQAMPFVGRLAERARLQEAFQQSLTGTAVTVFVHGASGLGKSELVRRFTEGAVAGDGSISVFAGRCYEHAETSYKAFQTIADQLGRHMDGLPAGVQATLMPEKAGLLPQLFPILGRVKSIAKAPLVEIDRVDPHGQRRLLFGCFRELLCRQARSRPTIIVIDDLQWADADTLALMSEVMHAPGAPPLLLLVTARPGMEQVWTDDVGGDVRHLDLGGLETPEGRELVGLLAPDLGQEQALTIVREAEGHPLFILELLRHLQERGKGAALKLDDALWARIARLPKVARALLEFLAVAGTPIELDTAANALDLTAAEAQLASRVLRTGFLTRGDRRQGTSLLEPYHDRVREATLAHLDQARRASLHGQVAFGLERAGAGASEPQLLVRHYAAAGQLDRAAAHAARAGEHASGIAAFDRAAELYGTALRLGDLQGPRQRSLRLARASALANAGRGLEAGEAFMLAAQGASPTVAIDCHKRAAEQWIFTGHLEEGLSASAALLASIGEPMAKTRGRALASLLWYRFRIRIARRRPADRLVGELEHDTLTRLDVLKFMAHGLSLVDNIRGADFNARFLLQARRAGEPVRLAQALGIEAVYLATQGGRGTLRGRGLMAEVEALAAAHPNEGYLAAYALFAEGCVSYLEGHFAAASGSLEAAERGFTNEVGGTTFELNNARLFRIFALRQLGGLAQSRELSSAYLRDARRRGDRYLETTLRILGTDAVLAREDATRAETQLSLATWTPPEEGFHFQHWYELEARGAIALYRGQASEALAELDERFTGLEKSLLLRVQIVRAVSRWLRSRLLLAAAATRGQRSVAPPAVARNIRRLAREGVGYAMVYSLLLRAGQAALASVGDDSATVDMLGRAILAGDANDMAHCAAAARYRLGTILGGDEGAELLAAAQVWFDREQVSDTARFVETIAPGFPNR